MRRMFMFERVRTLSLVLAFAAGVIPFVTYINGPLTGLLWLMTLVNFFAYGMAALTTIRITLDVASREKSKIAVPARYAADPAGSKWAIAVKASQRWHVLAVMPRLMLALGWVQWLNSAVNITFICCSFPGESSLAQPFYYTSNPGYPDFAPVMPQIETTLLAGIILLLFALAEVRLLAALTLLMHRYLLLPGAGKRMLTLMLRVLALPMLAGSLNLAEPLYIHFHWQQPDQRTFARVYDTWKVALVTLVDDSTLLAANIMRPVGEGTMFATIYHYDENGHATATTDSRSFVARQIVAGLLGLLLYALLTRGCLRLAKSAANEVQHENL